MNRRILLLLIALVLCLTAGLAVAEGTTVEIRGLTLSSGTVRYPVLLPEEEELLQAANGRITEAGLIPDRLNRMAMLLSGGEIQVTPEYTLWGDVFSCVFSAEGQLYNNRRTHEWNACNVDLLTGEEIPFEALFTDPEAARLRIEEILEEEIAPEMSAHLQNGELTPLPELFALTRTGLRLLYPMASLSTLSDKAGEVVLGWNEIRDLLDLSENGIPDRIGVPEMLEMTEASAEKLREAAAAGSLPDLPVTLGSSLKEAVDTLHLLTDPDVFDGGRLFAPEPGAFRNVFLLTDHLSEAWDHSRIQGIRLERGCLYGLCVGQTEKETWRMILGEPDTVVIYDADKAEGERTVPGECDYYTMGDHTLKILSDEEGILRVITLLD